MTVPAYLGRILSGPGGPTLGTCFQIADGVLVTAAHVLARAEADVEGRVISFDGLDVDVPVRAAKVARIDVEHDLAVLTTEHSLPASAAHLLASDQHDPGVEVRVTGAAEIPGIESAYRMLDASGIWQGRATQENGANWGRISCQDVLRGMSGAPVRRSADDAVIGIISGRYNSADGWLRDAVWVARTEDLQPLLSGIANIMVEDVPSPESTRKSQQGITPQRFVYGEIPARSPEFQDRDQFRLLASNLEATPQANEVFVLAGGRGVGKTQIAAQYVRECNSRGWTFIAWVAGDDEERLISDLAAIAFKLGIAPSDGDARRAAAELRGYLNLFEYRSLLVVDNAANPSEVRKWLPTIGSTVVVITTTNRAFQGFGRLIDVSSFDRTQSLNYLSVRTNLIVDQRPTEIASKLGDLPLALAQAASVINFYRIGYSQYIEKLNGIQIADALPSMEGDQYPLGAAEAILLAVETVELNHDSVAVRRILNFTSVMAPSGVRRILLLDVLSRSFGWSGELNNPLEDSDYHTALNLIPVLVTMSILQWDETGRSVIMHRLIGRVIRDRMAKLALFPAIVGSICGALPDVIYKEDYRESAEHALSIWDALQEKEDQLPNPVASFRDCIPLVSWGTNRLVRASDFQRAIEFCGRAFRKSVTLFGYTDEQTRDLVVTLSSAYRNADLCDQALDFLVEDLNRLITEAISGTRNNPARTRSQIAITLSWQGHENEAVILHKDVLSALRKLNAADAEMLEARDKLAVSYFILGKSEYAIPILEYNFDSTRDRPHETPSVTLDYGRKLACGYLIAEDVASARALFHNYLDPLQENRGKTSPSAGPPADGTIDMSSVINAFVDLAKAMSGPRGPIDLESEVALLPISFSVRIDELLDRETSLRGLYSLGKSF